jgi:hypothetical protein
MTEPKRVRKKASVSRVRIKLSPQGKSTGSAKIVRFGSVEVKSPAPDVEHVRLNIERGSAALARAKVALTRA